MDGGVEKSGWFTNQKRGTGVEVNGRKRRPGREQNNTTHTHTHTFDISVARGEVKRRQLVSVVGVTLTAIKK